jgi:hypothetical protein
MMEVVVFFPVVIGTLDMGVYVAVEIQCVFCRGNSSNHPGSNVGHERSMGVVPRLALFVCRLPILHVPFVAAWRQSSRVGWSSCREVAVIALIGGLNGDGDGASIEKYNISGCVRNWGRKNSNREKESYKDGDRLEVHDDIRVQLRGLQENI